ncbi:UNVERIFIED_CONTAM: acyl-CoA reductase-like NAD-dependent aldehyde dehydrogenase [Streptomyces canus]
MTDTPTQLFVGGAWLDAADGATMPVDDPATGEILCRIADAGPKDARLAEEAAVQAQEEWARTAPRARSEILRRAYEIILERTDELAHLMTAEMGKPLAEARGEVAYAAEFFRWFSEEAVRIDGGAGILPDGRNRMLLSRRPVGPCLLITPWNFPLAMGTRKIGPAIAAGCTMVLKPAPQTPLSSLALAAILQEAGLPDGVLNVVTTSRAGQVCEPLLRGGRIRKLSFTGSTAVGQLLLAQSAEAVVRTSMELGGNAPFIVFEDADLDKAVDGAMLAKMRNMGEACTAANRFFVHHSVAEEFGRRLAERMGALVVGPGTRNGVDVGPLIDRTGRGQGGGSGRRRGGARRPGPRRWPYAGGPGLLLSADRTHRRVPREPPHGHGDLRSRRRDPHLRRRGRGDPASQRHPLGSGRLRLHRGPGPRPARQ